MVLCAMVIIVVGIVGWFYPWFRLPEAYIRYYDVNFLGVFISLSVSSKIKPLQDPRFKQEFTGWLSPAPLNPKDGFASDWHLVHLGSRAVGSAGLVMTEAATSYSKNVGGYSQKSIQT